MNRTVKPTGRIAAALVWEFWAQGWRGILPATLGAIVLPGLVISTLSAEFGAPLGETQVGNLLEFSFYWVTLVCLGAPVIVAIGNSARHYTLPASSFVLVAVPMTCAMATLFAEYVLVAMTLNAVTDAGWEVWGPGLLAAVLMAWGQAMLLWHPLLVLASFFPLLFAVKWWGPAIVASMAEPLGISGWNVVAFLLASTVCVVVGTIGFANRRHGSEIDMRAVVERFSQRFRYWTAARRGPFRSSTAAQFWLEWTERGYVLPVGTAVLGIGLVLLAWSLPASGESDFVRGAWGFFLAPMLVIGMFWGSRSSQLEFGNFNGTRPLSDAQVAHAILKSATLGMISAAAIWAVCMAAIVLIMGEGMETQRLHREIQRMGAGTVAARVALGGLAAWGAVGLVTSLVLAGRKVFGIAVWLAIGVTAAGVLVSLYLPQESRAAFARSYVQVWLVVCVFVCAAVFLASWRRRLISMPLVWLAAGLVLAALAAAQAGGLTADWKYLPGLLCLCGSIPIPLAAAPLAAFVNRHR